jgi:hypothetical protein
MKGRLYEYLGVDWNIAYSSSGLERYKLAIGDIAAAEVMGGSPSNLTTLPTSDTRVKKEWLLDPSSNVVMANTISQDGSNIQNVQTTSGMVSSTRTVGNNSIIDKVTSVVTGVCTTGTILGGTKLLVVASATGFSPGQTIIMVGSPNLQGTIFSISGNSITLVAAAPTSIIGGMVVVLGTTLVTNVYTNSLNATSGIAISYQNITTVYSSTSPTPVISPLTLGDILLTPTGITMAYGAPGTGMLSLTSAGVSMTYGAYFCTVGPGGFSHS